MKKHLPSVAFFLLIIVIWELSVKIAGIETYILPSPIMIGKALTETYGLLWEHGVQTMYEALQGFIIAIIFGFILAVLMEMISLLKRMFYPLIVLSQTIPVMAVAPLLIIWFSYGILPKVVVVVLVCFFPITVSLVEGLEKIDRDMEKLLLAMGATTWQIFKIVQLPGALPSFFASLKISATYSITGAVIAEWLGASKGLGVFMIRSMHSFLTARVFAAIVVVAGLSLVLFGIIMFLERLAMPWYYPKIPGK